MSKTSSDRNMALGKVTRRGFLKGASVTAVTTALLDNGLAHAAEEQAKKPSPNDLQIIGPGEIAVALNINGQDKTVNVEPRTTLAEALRIHLDLTGTKVVCDRGACSACTVWLNGTPVNSCMTLAVDVGDRKITTIEGLSHGTENLHPVQEQFVEHDALQCGFCTPGMVMSCAALLNRNPHPTEQDVRDAVSGNLCRCGTYPKVFAATLAAAKSGYETTDAHG